MSEVVVVDAVRTPTGRFGGCFKEVGAVTLAARVIEDVLARTGVGGDAVDEVIMGMVYQGGRARIRRARPHLLRNCPMQCRR